MVKAKYTKYKSSNISRIWDIPYDWKIFKNKWFMNRKKELVGAEVNNYTVLSLTLQWIIDRNLENNFWKHPASYETYQIVQKDTIVMCLFDIDVTPRIVGIVPREGMITGAYTNFEIDKDKADERYIYYFLLRMNIENILLHMSKSLRSTLTYWEFLSQYTCLPSLLEQKAIANYLDDKSYKIDEAITIKKKQIQLLKERRVALINQIVIKWLDHKTEMVNTEIEWMQKMPKGWKMRKLKYLIKLVNKKSNNNHSKVYVWLEHIESGLGKLLDVGHSTEVVGDTNTFKAWDLLFSKLRPYLAKAFVAWFDWNCTWELLIMEMWELVSNMFMKYKILSQSFISLVNNSTYWTKMPRASWEFIWNIEITYPDLTEQKKIVDYLDFETHKIEETIKIIEQSIVLLTEYKESLVSYAVTGKIKVF